MPTGYGAEIPKREDVSDPLSAREEHAEAINATSPATGRREPPLQRFKVALIYLRWFVCALGVADLILEFPSLFKGRVLLFVGVDDLPPVDEELCARRNTLLIGRVNEGL